jgi:hypothetical protein
MARHCRVVFVNQIENAKIASVSVWSATKSQLHNWQGRSACRCAVEIPSRFFRRCFLLNFDSPVLPRRF